MGGSEGLARTRTFLSLLLLFGELGPFLVLGLNLTSTIPEVLVNSLPATKSDLKAEDAAWKSTYASLVAELIALGQRIVTLENQGASGPAGKPGTPGVPGLDGINGPTGPSGANGVSVTGNTGADGPTGAPGGPGVTGPTGLGITGSSGFKGDTGNAGPTGSTGDKGATGDSGPAGPTGPSGARGDTGPIGPTGGTGAQGDTGAKGDTGPSGPTGPTGPEECPIPTTNPNLAYLAATQQTVGTLAANANPTAIGQIFTPPAPGTITAFSINIPFFSFIGSLTFAAYLYAWDTSRPGPTGSNLFVSGPLTITANVPGRRRLHARAGTPASYSFTIPNCLNLKGGTPYVIFLDTGDYPQGNGAITSATVDTNVADAVVGAVDVLVQGNTGGNATFTTAASTWVPSAASPPHRLPITVTYG